MRRRLMAALLAAGLLTGCAVRTQFQGCVIRCPDMTKDPDQIEAEGERAARIARVSVAPGGGTMTRQRLRLTRVVLTMGLFGGPGHPKRSRPSAGSIGRSSSRRGLRRRSRRR